MDLIRKTNTSYLIFLAFLMPIMIGADYFLIQYLFNSEVEETLLHEEERIQYHLAKDGDLPISNYLHEVTPIDKGFELNPKFKDTLFFEAYTDKNIPYRLYSFSSSIDQKPVKITLRHMLPEIEELIWFFFIATFAILLLLVIGLYLIHQEIYRSTWHPFFKNLSMLKQYDFSKMESTQLNSSGIREFEEINQVIITLMEQVRKDFQNLKEFNENISHEIQTPLAIIRNKVVHLLESKNLNKNELRQVESIYQETNKLSKIGKALTLISRIENQEFKRLDRVDVSTLVENILNNMEEIINFKNLDISTELQPMTIECDHILADILFTNLINNAIQHNKEGGWIKIRLSTDTFEITNCGDVSEVKPDKLFDRFQKGSSSKDSLGLGLAINQKICEIYEFTLNYESKEEIHTFSLRFKA
ncbi:HAMP domain-containing histidine kinase [Aureitalea sp. L0-47]|uniref:sensor histidine kinase n=1 Tax=Aureitalea sp. L0-47 TaxID=2816962 RepID=UPI0022380C2A|nr:HAMP domain-containing sensor histidine kinase [Aureitalea sp. L0-47]MCW5518245.1 HAMP domain-containing histidine kinase [Aureitalea sp. L0-47]